jgi:hypothetical protein
MLNKLASSPGVKLFREAAEFYGLGYTVSQQGDVEIPAYSGSISLNYAHAGR